MLLRSMVLECFKARLSAAGTADSSDGCALTEGVLPLLPSPTVENVVKQLGPGKAREAAGAQLLGNLRRRAHHQRPVDAVLRRPPLVLRLQTIPISSISALHTSDGEPLCKVLVPSGQPIPPVYFSICCPCLSITTPSCCRTHRIQRCSQESNWD